MPLQDVCLVPRSDACSVGVQDRALLGVEASQPDLSENTLPEVENVPEDFEADLTFLEETKFGTSDKNRSPGEWLALPTQHLRELGGIRRKAWGLCWGKSLEEDTGGVILLFEFVSFGSRGFLSLEGRGREVKRERWLIYSLPSSLILIALCLGSLSYPDMEMGGGDLFQRLLNSGCLPFPGDLLMFSLL